VILDSCFLIDVMVGDDHAVTKKDELLDSSVATGVPAPSVTEVEWGLADGVARQQFRSLMEDMSVLPYDHQIARTAADVLRTLDERGEPIGALDGMVAATAKSHDEAVVTRNVSEFNRVDGLTVSPY